MNTAGRALAHYGRYMAVSFTPEAFYDGARDFAQTALVAHHAQQHRRVALDAGTSLEYLLKACLASRSPALLTELRNEGNFSSLLRLLGIAEDKTPRQVRTVSLRDALTRVKMFVKSSASEPDLGTLVNMRDGTVHAAQDDEIEERLLVAFVQHADALLEDLGRDRTAFWDVQLAVVDALLSDASDKIAHRVEVKLAQALANFERQYGGSPPEMLRLVRSLANPRILDDDQALADCPACESPGVAAGEHDVEWSYEDDGSPIGTVWFIPGRFECHVCGLQLDWADLEAAPMEAQWQDEDANPINFERGAHREL